MAEDMSTKVACPKVRGVDLMRDPQFNKGMAFTLKERQMWGLHGLLPPAQIDQDQQVDRVLVNFHRWENDLDRYIYLISLQDRNEKLFYKVVTSHIDLMLPIIYTPTVGLACQKYGMVFRKPRGLFITVNDIGHVYDILCNWPVEDVKYIVVTDGERILGLGDLGAYGMGIPVGKLSLYTGLAGVHPSQCLPIMIDVGTDNQTLLEDPLYIGLRQKRERGPKYDNLLDEFMEAVKKRYGSNTLVQFEDFGNANAFRFLEKYRNQYCVFNDDIQGTAAVAVAGILASLRITGNKLSKNVFVFQGAGEASIGIASLVVMAMEAEGVSKQAAIDKIYMVDSKGLIVKNRPSGGVTGHKTIFAKNQKPMDKLEDIVEMIKPSVIIGAAAVPGAFTEKILKTMGKNNKHPVIFALSNPTSKAECTAQEAYQATQGQCVFASGSPFPNVTLNGRTFSPGQGNNAYIFPGVALATVVCDIRVISEEVFLQSAKSLASLVTEADLKAGRVYPPLADILNVSTKIAADIATFSYKNGTAHRYPEPENKLEFIKSVQYSTDYDTFIPHIYSWPATQ